jgi:serine/threonine protein kinase
MEYLEGETLREAMARGDLPGHVVISMLLQGMRGVAEAHAQGIIHRDIKPENIFLAREADTPTPVTKVLDFGISKLATDEEHSALTATGAPIGTTLYMSYEQLAGQKDIDARADVYSFGVVLYEALTGRRPYEGTFTEVICKMLEGPPIAPEQHNPGLPTSLSRLILWALDKERETRVSSLKELVRELEPFSTSRGMQSELSSGGPDRTPLALAPTESRMGVPRAVWQAPRDSNSTPDTRRLRVQKRALLGAALLSVVLLAVAPALWSKLHGPLPTTSRAPLATATQKPRVPAAPSPSETAAAPREPTPKAVLQAAPVDPRTTDQAPTREDGGESVARVDAEVVAAARGSTGRLGADASVASLPKRGARATTDLSSASTKPTTAEARTQAKLERLIEQLVACGELRTPWLREQCQADRKREIAEYKEQRELVKSVSGR